jgi:hypothetical protein
MPLVFEGVYTNAKKHMLSSILRLARRITNQALHEMSLEYVWDKVILLIDLLWSTSQSVELILSVMEKI